MSRRTQGLCCIGPAVPREARCYLVWPPAFLSASESFSIPSVREAGKPAQAARTEIARAIQTFTVASEEAKRFGGDIIPLDGDAGAAAYEPAISYWVPRGVVLGITPFNFPLNLVAHKVAPALAVGAPIIIKPAHQAPGGATLLAEIFERAAKAVSSASSGSADAIPLTALQVLSCTNEVAETAITSPEIATVSFTGSTHVGWWIQSKAIGKRVLLELGGNAGVIVHRDADLSRAAARVAQGGFGYAGQSCISVQRVFVDRVVAADFEKRLVEETRKLKTGDPSSEETFVGPLIDAKAADRVMAWINEAVKAGAAILAGGRRVGNTIEPTVVTKVRRQLPLVCEEVFGPVVVVEIYDTFSDAIAGVNNSRFGLQAGVFTDSQSRIREAVDGLEVGGVTINEIPTFRADQMPYGGVKQSGLGREGLRYAMEEYSERRTVVTWRGHR